MTSPAPPTTTTDPWDRFGWIMGAIWLVFLFFPITGLALSERPMLWKVLGIATIVLFAVVYVRGFVKLGNSDTWESVTVTGTRHLAVLVLIILVLVPLLGAQVLAQLPYVVALGMFSLPLAWAFSLAGAALLVTVIVPFLDHTFAEQWYLTLVVLLVAVATGMVRLLDQSGDQARAAQAELALAAERDRVARDVHDVLGHSLTVVTVKAELAQRLIATDPDQAKAELDQIHSLSRTALAEIRATVAGLRVASLAEELAAADTALTGAGISSHLPEDLGDVDPRHRVLLGWVLREAVTNVVRHSNASTCTVTLGAHSLQVVDDGCGFSGKEGNGLRGIRERVADAGGTITVTPGASGGTVLEVTL